MERRNKCFRKIKYTIAPEHKSGITSIDIPVNDDGSLNLNCNMKTWPNWITITDPAEIERIILLRNQQHFSQAQGTPLTESPFSDVLDFWVLLQPQQQSQTALTQA